MNKERSASAETGGAMLQNAVLADVMYSTATAVDVDTIRWKYRAVARSRQSSCINFSEAHFLSVSCLQFTFFLRPVYSSLSGFYLTSARGHDPQSPCGSKNNCEAASKVSFLDFPTSPWPPFC